MFPLVLLADLGQEKHEFLHVGGVFLLMDDLTRYKWWVVGGERDGGGGRGGEKGVSHCMMVTGVIYPSTGSGQPVAMGDQGCSPVLSFFVFTHLLSCPTYPLYLCGLHSSCP